MKIKFVPLFAAAAAIASLGITAAADGNDVAEMNGTGYATLQQAIDAAAAGATVTLKEDVTENVIISQDDNVTIDLNGCSITSNGYNPIVTYGVLKITDSSTEKDGLISVSGYADGIICSGENAKLYFENGNIESANSNGISVEKGAYAEFNGGYVEAQECAIGVYKDSTIIVNGGKLKARDNAVIAGNGTNTAETTYSNTTITINGGELEGNITTSGYVACGIYQPQQGVLNINGGTITVNGGAGIVARGGIVNISEDAVITTNGNATGKVGDSRVVVPCSAIVYDSEAGYYDNENVKINISGGDFTSVAEVITVVCDETDGEANSRISISGGTFTSDISEYLAAGCASGEIGGSYEVISSADPASKAGTYKNAANEDGSYDQMTLFDFVSDNGNAVNVQTIGFTITNSSNENVDFNYKNNMTISGSGTAMIGLIVTDIPEGETVTIDMK